MFPLILLASGGSRCSLAHGITTPNLCLHDQLSPLLLPQNSIYFSLTWTHLIVLRPTQLIYGEDNGNPLQYSCLGNPMDGGAWKAGVHGVARSWTRLSDFTFTFHFHALEKEMATHSSVLAQRIPRTGEPGGLPSMGLHRVRHYWSNLAAAAVDNLGHIPPFKILLIFFLIQGIFTHLPYKVTFTVPGTRTWIYLSNNLWHLGQTYFVLSSLEDVNIIEKAIICESW